MPVRSHYSIVPVLLCQSGPATAAQTHQAGYIAGMALRRLVKSTERLEESSYGR
jgi:hypothetical protein